MNKNDDGELIKKFIEWCISKDFNQNKIALIVGKTKGWASLLINGKIHRLQFDTKNQIKKLIGEQ